MEFWFLKRIEKEALLNQSGKLGKHHTRLNSARSRERASLTCSLPESEFSPDEEARDGEDIVALSASANAAENGIDGTSNDSDNVSRDGQNDEDGEERDRERAVSISPQRRAIGMLSISLDGEQGSEKRKDERKERNHPFYKEESDKSFLWGRGGSLGGSSSALTDPDGAAQPPKIKSGWRGVFRKYHQLERNWKEGNCAVKTLVSRRRVYCILFSEEKQLLWSGNAKGTPCCICFACCVRGV
jgi:hypothetical protein